MTDRELLYEIKGACFDVYNELGPGLLESVYKQTLAYQLTENGRLVQVEHPIPVVYHGVKLDHGFRADLIVDRRVIIEIKSVDEIAPVHHLQLKTYLRLSGIHTGLLVNFNTSSILNGMHVWHL